MSYGRVAALAGNARAARGVGYALSHVDGEGLPCHRVVFADGSLARDAVFGGEGVQRRLLEAEGRALPPRREGGYGKVRALRERTCAAGKLRRKFT